MAHRPGQRKSENTLSVQTPELPSVGGVLLGHVVASGGQCVKVADVMVFPLATTW